MNYPSELKQIKNFQASWWKGKHWFFLTENGLYKIISPLPVVHRWSSKYMETACFRTAPEVWPRGDAQASVAWSAGNVSECPLWSAGSQTLIFFFFWNLEREKEVVILVFCYAGDPEARPENREICWMSTPREPRCWAWPIWGKGRSSWFRIINDC